jgi:nucleotide-binding universal stress UspA family protein
VLDEPGVVVVGVDGTERSVDALRCAAVEAGRRGCHLLAVLAFGDAPLTAPYAPVPALCAADPPASAAERLDLVVRAAFGGLPPVPVRAVCDPRPPVPALLTHAAGADLLVLATSPEPDRPTGRGSYTTGSTALDCVRHAPCPVLLLPVPHRQPAWAASLPPTAAAHSVN